MTVTLSLAAFVATFFPMLVAGIGLGLWAARRRVEPKRESPDDLRKTVDGTVNIQELLDKCKRKEI